jgi:hypothetical protein
MQPSTHLFRQVVVEQQLYYTTKRNVGKEKAHIPHGSGPYQQKYNDVGLRRFIRNKKRKHFHCACNQAGRLRLDG